MLVHLVEAAYERRPVGNVWQWSFEDSPALVLDTTSPVPEPGSSSAPLPPVNRWAW